MRTIVNNFLSVFGKTCIFPEKTGAVVFCGCLQFLPGFFQWYKLALKEQTEVKIEGENI